MSEPNNEIQMITPAVPEAQVYESIRAALADNEKLFASKYRLYLPTEEELKAKLEREREFIERKLAEDEGNL